MPATFASRSYIIWDLVDDKTDCLVPGESVCLLSLISILYICHRFAARAMCALARYIILYFVFFIEFLLDMNLEV